MGRGSKIISLRMPADLWEHLMGELSKSHQQGLSVSYGYGEWIRDSIDQRLRHLDRSRKIKREKIHVCSMCGKKKPSSQFAVQWENLFGVVEFRCSACTVKPA